MIAMKVMNSKDKQKGLTLIEIIITIVILSIAIVALANSMAVLSQRSSDPMIQQQSLAIAESYIEEVTNKPFLDPTTQTVCPAAPAVRSEYNNVCDYTGLPDTLVRDQAGNAISELSDYRVTVSIATSGDLNGLTSTDVLRVDVTVTDPLSNNLALTVFRANY